MKERGKYKRSLREGMIDTLVAFFFSYLSFQQDTKKYMQEKIMSPCRQICTSRCVNMTIIETNILIVESELHSTEDMGTVAR